MDIIPARGLYIHWPFCKSKCPYCDFNSHVRASIDEGAWTQAYVNALQKAAATTPTMPIKSIFFGGGTPSLMPPALVARILEEVHALWPVLETVEITLEANPNSAEVAHFQDLRAAGINRVSIGIQALNDTDLKALGRGHTAAEGRAAIQSAARVFPRYSFDLIYARAHQTIAEWRTELAEALTLAGDHLSLYQLTIEPGTVFHHRFQNGQLDVLDEDTSYHLFMETQEILEKAGLPAYEVSNHARPGQECLHNLVYWHGEEYIGVGPGAHGRIEKDGARHATRQHRAPELWLDKALSADHAEQTTTPLTNAEVFVETLMMGLRIREGILKSRLTKELWAQKINAERWKTLTEHGFAFDTDTHIGLTPQGRIRLNSILAYIL